MLRCHRPNSAKMRIPVWLVRRVTGKKRARPPHNTIYGSSILQDMESNSMEELARIEPPEKPPTLEQLDELTGGRFSRRWLKYMYNRFKNVSSIYG